MRVSTPTSLIRAPHGENEDSVILKIYAPQLYQTQDSNRSICLVFFRIFFAFLALLDFAQLIRKIFWDPPCIFGTRLARDVRLSALESVIFELKIVCWGGGRQTPPFFSTNFFLKNFKINFMKIVEMRFLS